MDRRVLWVVVLFLGCHADACDRHAQWLTHTQCEEFCEDYEGVALFDDGCCRCRSSESSSGYRKRRIEDLKRELERLQGEEKR